jgi:NAD(P)-dependent dehydrogenase (short-subunit alcohol dehydrogenase family)
MFEMPRELADAVAIVTGGSSGSGLATARALVSHTEQRYGGIDLAHLNAGGGAVRAGPVERRR